MGTNSQFCWNRNNDLGERVQLSISAACALFLSLSLFLTFDLFVTARHVTARRSHRPYARIQSVHAAAETVPRAQRVHSSCLMSPIAPINASIALIQHHLAARAGPRRQKAGSTQDLQDSDGCWWL